MVAEHSSSWELQRPTGFQAIQGSQPQICLTCMWGNGRAKAKPESKPLSGWHQLNMLKAWSIWRIPSHYVSLLCVDGEQALSHNFLGLLSAMKDLPHVCLC